jgi:predicted nuclease of restriction endonuclease-like (RecB) superfamily
MTTDVTNSKAYMVFLNEIKKDIQISRVRAALSINKELILLYWRIGKGILERQKDLGWGAKVIEHLSFDLKQAFPHMKGFSSTNLKYMRILAGRISEHEMSPQSVDQIPWGHIRALMDAFEDKNLWFWYIQKTIENGWSRNVLVMHIENQSHLKLGQAQTNFSETLPKPTSDLVQQLIKNEYNFDFLGITEDVHEKVIEKGLINHIRDFLLQLGSGFAFLGSQYKLTVGGEDFFCDLLFYHVRLRSYTVLEIKTDKFKPEYAGKLGFYITAINKQIKSPDDGPTIGLLLCKQANKVVVEYALNDNKQPMGVAEYTTGLPSQYKDLLPTPEQFQHLIDTLETEETP